MLLALPWACAPPPEDSRAAAPAEAPVPDVAIDTTSLSFTSDASVATVGVANAGDGELVLDEPVVDAGAFTANALGATTLGPGEETTFAVTWSGAEATGTVFLGTNDPDEPTVTLALTGHVPAPSLVVEPASWDFGDLTRDCSADAAFTVANAGDAPLTVTALATTGGDDAFALAQDGAPLPWTLAPGESRAVAVAFRPPWLGHFAGGLVVTSDDPANPSAAAGLDGEGVDDIDAVEDFYVSGGRVDVVISVYAGDTMADEQADLVDAADELMDALDDGLLDWRLALVEDDDGCVQGADRWIDATVARGNRAAAYEEMLATDQPAVHGFTMLDAALDAAATGSGGCNEGLLRDDARLAIVGVTDQGGMPSDGWSPYVSTFQALKASPDDVTMHGIAPNRGADCGTSSTSSGWHEAAVATGGLDLLVCDPMDDDLVAIADALVEPQTAFALAGVPRPETLAVYLDGVATDAFAYDETANEVTVASDVALGTLVTVAYVELPVCAE